MENFKTYLRWRKTIAFINLFDNLRLEKIFVFSMDKGIMSEAPSLTVSVIDWCPASSTNVDIRPFVRF